MHRAATKGNFKKKETVGDNVNKSGIKVIGLIYMKKGTRVELGIRFGLKTTARIKLE